MKEDQISYSQAEWEYIYSRKPELRPNTKREKPAKPSLDSIIVLFLEKYEVFVKPVTSRTNKRGANALAGAVTGLAGADVGGDAFMISGQSKQTQVQEWTQWKQWALDHKDFPAFKEETLLRFDEESKTNNVVIVEDPLSNPNIRKEITELMEGRKKVVRFAMLFIGIIILIVWASQ
tara:strand:- start:142 stop:672 length:531 start_codon:yes stop_codon:yes gene_type:complete